MKQLHFITVPLSLVLTTVMALGTASAQAPKFHAAGSAVNNVGALVVSWDERGLGNDDVDYTLTADASALYACINRGGNHPQATNKETVNAEVTASGSFEPKNGRVTASLSAGPPSAGAFSCPSGQRLLLAAVSYTNIVCTDVTNNVATSVPDAARTFFDLQ